jgi:hypothetical protein
MVSNGNGFDIVEIKATKTITNSLFKGLDNLATVADDTIKRKVLVYGGKDSQTRTNHQIWSWKDIKSEF